MDRRFIVQLKEEHRIIIAFLNKINLSGGNTATLQKTVAEMKDVVIGHLRKEDEIVYPHLLRSKNIILISLGESFLRSMTVYSEIFTDVTRRIQESDNSIDPTLILDYESMKNTIKDRIFIEEKILFPAYESLDEYNKE